GRAARRRRRRGPRLPAQRPAAGRQGRDRVLFLGQADRPEPLRRRHDLGPRRRRGGTSAAGESMNRLARGGDTAMRARALGNSGLQVGPLAFGGNVFGWTADEPTSFRLLDAFVAAGFNLIDTAYVYSRWAPGNQGGESETILGKWLKQRGKRDKVIVATKVGM